MTVSQKWDKRVGQWHDHVISAAAFGKVLDRILDLSRLPDADKRALTARAARWLCPGGRLVIADMMFGRGGSRRDRAILRQKVAALAAKLKF